jgi:hypothetical protein
MAPASMKGDHQVALLTTILGLDPHLVAERPKDP